MNKTKINIAHEAPLDAMDYVQHLTDYDYALSVLFDKVDGYYDFFKLAKAKGRYILLDNGVFENGVSMDSETYAKWITSLEPNEYIVPDALSNLHETITLWEKWNNNFKDLPGKRIGVVQGANLEETMECYNFMSDHADKIAIPFGLSWYYTSFAMNDNKWNRATTARTFLLTALLNKSILNHNKPHHLLGANLPYEFSAYSQNNKFIESIDTSNPVIHALVEGKYPHSIYSIPYKLPAKIKDLITMKCDKNIIADICFNIAQFKIENNL